MSADFKQTTIPILIHEDRIVTQLQQNIKQAFQNLQSQTVQSLNSINLAIAALPSVPIPVAEGGTGADLSGSTGVLKLNAGVSSVGVVPIAFGGTGQSSAGAAFNALSPMSVLGDLIYGGVSGVGTRLPIGTSGNVLTVSGGIPSWQPLDLSTYVVGPSSATDNAITRFDGTTGKLIQNSLATISDLGNLTANNFSGTSSGTNTGDQTITLTGDVTGTGTSGIATTIANSAVTNAKLANIANNTVKGNKSGGSAAPSDLTLSDVTEATSSVLTITNGSKTIVGSSNLTVQVKQASTSQSGYLSNTDWNTFNGKLASPVAVLDTTWTYDNLGTVGSNHVTYIVIGKYLMVQGSVIAGTPVGATFAINIPGGVGTIDTTKYTTDLNTQILGSASRYNAGQSIPGVNNGPFALFYDGSTNSKVYLSLLWNALNPQFNKANGTSFIAAGQLMTFYFNVALT